MKKQLVAVSMVFFALYVMACIMLLFKYDVTAIVIQHMLFCVLGMICIFLLIRKNTSGFAGFFAITAAIYYFFTSFGSIVYSLIRDELSAFENLGAYARTEIFVFVSVFCFLLFHASKKKIHKAE